MRTYNLFIVTSAGRTQLLTTTTLATFVQAVQAIQLGGNTAIKYKAGGGGFLQVQGFEIEVIDP